MTDFADPHRSSAFARPATLLVALALLAAEFALVSARMQPPAPQGTDAPANEFSAGRATKLLQEILAEEVPRPVGSAANVRVGERIAEHLRELGYTVAIQEAEGCNRRDVCATVRNIIARLPGRNNGPAVMLASHYDGVETGPAVADAGAAVAAILETARILKAEGPFQNPIVLLITDGEEAGLLGAEAFAAEHPWADSIGAVLNFEARGTSGASFMFETSNGNAWLIDAYARAVSRPNTSSLFYEAYRRLPNDTDFSVFKRYGIEGLNFAFIGDAIYYHTPRDNFENLDQGSLQHHGDNALALARTLASADLSASSPENAVYTDLFSALLIRWPEPATIPLAAAVVLFLVGATVRALRQGDTRLGTLAWGVAGWGGIVVAAIGSGVALAQLIAAFTEEAGPWWTHPLPARISLWAGVLFAGGLVALLVGRRAGFWGMLLTCWVAWAILGLLTAIWVPGVSVVFLVPTAVAALAILLAVFFPADQAWVQEAAAVLGSLAAGAVWFKLALGLEMAFGFGLSPAITLPVAVVVTTLAPLFAVRRGTLRIPIAVIAGAGAVMVAAAASAIFVGSRATDQPVVAAALPNIRSNPGER